VASARSQFDDDATGQLTQWPAIWNVRRKIATIVDLLELLSVQFADDVDRPVLENKIAQDGYRTRGFEAVVVLTGIWCVRQLA
jgi:hypothetical protein